MFKFAEVVTDEEKKSVEPVNGRLFDEVTSISPEKAVSFWDENFSESLPEISIKDILGYSEEDFSFGDYDISDMRELLKHFDEAIWSKMSEDEKIDKVDQAVEKISKILELEETPEVMYFEDDPSVCGQYYSGCNMLGINVCELNDPKELIDTIAHELRHAYQEQRTANQIGRAHV